MLNKGSEVFQYEMEFDETFQWLIRSERRKEVVANFDQPLTARQLSCRMGLSIDSCSYLFWELSVYGLVWCLNPEAGSNRLHWLTAPGKVCQTKLRKALQLPALEHHFPKVDWYLYGQVCFRHRSAAIKALAFPMRPVAIKRKAKEQNPKLRMSANNVRDVIRILLDFALVKPVWKAKQPHPSYELIEQGPVFRELLLKANLLPRHSYRALRLPVTSHIDNLNLITNSRANNSVEDSPVRRKFKDE